MAKIKLKKSQNIVVQSFFQKDIPLLYSFAFLFLTVVLLYLQTLDNPIVFDTAQNFNDNVLNGYFDSFNLFNNRSISYFTIGLVYKLVQSDWAWHRAINILFHGINACLVFFFLKNLFLKVLGSESKTLSVTPSWVAFMAGLIFAISPVAVYGTAYLIQRSIQMATMFSLGTLIFYFYGVDQKKWWWFLLSAVSYFLAMHSKEHCIMIPAVAFSMSLILNRFAIHEYKKPHFWANVLVYVLYALTALFVFLKVKGIIGQVYEPHGAGMISSANVKHSVLTADTAYPLSILTQSFMFFKYMLLWIFPDPRHLYIDIHLPFATHFISWPYTATFVAFCLYPLVCFWLLFKKGVKSLLGFGLLSAWFLFLTEVTVVRLSEQFVLYRSYIWASSFFAILPAFFAFKYKENLFYKLKIFISVVYLLLMLGIAVNRIDSFDSKVKIWRDVVEKIRGKTKNEALYKSYRPFNNLAFALTSSGKLVESIQYYYEAIRINPNYVKARSNLGAVLTNRGRYQEAIEHFKRAIELDPKYIDAHVGLGVCAAEQGNQEEAIIHYNNALKINPDYPDANFNMGNAFLKLKDYPKAVNYYKRAIKSKPLFADSHHNLGIALSNMGKIGEAQKAFEEAVRIKPDHKRSLEALRIIRSRSFYKKLKK